MATMTTQTTEKPITQKQQEILKLIYKYRFLNRIQIQAFLNHKYHKRINDWLKDLTQKEYVKRIYSNKFGENTKPAIYYLGLNGAAFIRTEYYLMSEQVQKLYRSKDRSEEYISQCVLIADIALNLQSHSIQVMENKEKKTEVTYEALTATDLADPDQPFGFLTELKPDLLVRKQSKKKTAKRVTTSHFIFKVFSPTLPRYSIRKRLKEFIDFYLEGEWEDNQDGPFPAIMLICPTLSTLIYAKRLTRRLLEEEDNPEGFAFRFTTVEELKKRGATGEIWEEI